VLAVPGPAACTAPRKSETELAAVRNVQSMCYLQPCIPCPPRVVNTPEVFALGPVAHHGSKFHHGTPAPPPLGLQRLRQCHLGSHEPDVELELMTLLTQGPAHRLTPAPPATPPSLQGYRARPKETDTKPSHLARTNVRVHGSSEAGRLPSSTLITT
jgi:hypothetical protein